MKGLITIKDAEMQKVQLKIEKIFKKTFYLIDKIPHDSIKVSVVVLKRLILE